MPALSKADANAVLQGALEKLTDAKLKAATSTLLLSLAEVRSGGSHACWEDPRTRGGGNDVRARACSKRR